MADSLDGLEDYPDVMRCPACAVAEAGRVLASLRDDLVVSGADPTTLAVPAHVDHPAGDDLFEHDRWGLVSCDCTCHPVNAGTELVSDPGRTLD